MRGEVYCLGLILYYVVAKRLPWEHTKFKYNIIILYLFLFIIYTCVFVYIYYLFFRITNHLNSKNPIIQPPEISNEYWQVIEPMLRINMKERPSPEEVYITIFL
jgi:hypothetical protein